MMASGPGPHARPRPRLPPHDPRDFVAGVLVGRGGGRACGVFGWGVGVGKRELVRLSVCYRIKQHAPPFICIPVNFFEF